MFSGTSTSSFSFHDNNGPILLVENKKGYKNEHNAVVPKYDLLLLLLF